MTADDDSSTFLDSLDSPMFLVGTKGNVTAWNRALQQQSGLEAALVRHHLLNDFLEDSTCWITAMALVFDSTTDPNGSIEQPELTEIDNLCHVQLRCNSVRLDTTAETDEITQSRWIRIQLSGRRDGSGNVIGALGTVSFPANSVSGSSEHETEATKHNLEDTSLSIHPLHLILPIAMSSSPIFGLNSKGCINQWNGEMKTLTNVDQEASNGQSFVEHFVAPAFRDTFSQILFTVLTTGIGHLNLELEISNERHGSRYLLLSIYPATTPRRNDTTSVTTTGVICVAQDVTEATKKNRAVATIASELRQLIENANAPIFGCDTFGNINEWNDMTAQITGFSKDEIADCSLIETFIAPYMKESVQDMITSSLQGHNTPNFDLDMCTKLGDIRHLLVNATTRRDADNNIVGVVAVAQDVTEAVLRDRAVAGMALELRQLIDTANAPIFGCDIDFNVNEWNRRTEEITGFLKEEAFGLPMVSTFIAQSMHSEVQEILLAALQGNETSNYELEVISKSGEPRLLLVNATTRRDPEGNIVGVVSVAQDATEDRKHAAELRKMQFLQATQQAKMETERNMTDYFAHELRNPLSAIDSALSAMPDNIPNSSRSLVTGMQLCVRFMSATMDNLLDVRRMEEGKVTLAKAPLSLSSLLAEIRGMIGPSVKPGVVLHTECDTAGRDWVVGDERRFQQMLTNVIANAVKYTLAGSITIRISWEDDMVKFSCIDTGPGITKSAQEALFQRFVQRGGAPGTGLGLAIAKNLVDLAGGTIMFDSDPSIATGTTCTVYVPLSVCDSPDILSQEDKLHRVIEAPLRFLIIDDVKMNRTMLKRRIQKKICPRSTIAEAPTGERALEICGTEKFDVIIVDQYMEEAGGVMVGTDVVYAMRRMRIDSIIIGCSGNDLDVEFGEAGVDWVWQKPMPSNEDIIAHLHAALAARHKL